MPRRRKVKPVVDTTVVLNIAPRPITAKSQKPTTSAAAAAALMIPSLPKPLEKPVKQMPIDEIKTTPKPVDSTFPTTTTTTTASASSEPSPPVESVPANVSSSSSMTATSVASSTASATTTNANLTPIQQLPNDRKTKVVGGKTVIATGRDILDPAPHHTDTDIKVLQILKRMRDGGSVDDEEFDTRPPKRKPGRSKSDRPSAPRLSPTRVLQPVLPQPTITTTTTTTLEGFKFTFATPSNTNNTNLLPRTTPSTATNATALTPGLKNGAAPTIVLAAANGTPANAGQGAVALLQPKTATTAVPQQMELVLANGIRIPLSTTTPAKQDGGTGVAIAPSLSHSPAPPPQPSTTNPLSGMSPAVTKFITSLAQQQSQSQPQKHPETAGGAATTPSNTNAQQQQQICACSRSKCLKLYCDCFAAGKACGDSCNCRHCYNNLANDTAKQTRDVAMRTVLSKNPLAFKPKIENTGKHVLGCRCKRSHCQKGYCECYLAKIPCNQRCRCLGCSNEESAASCTATTVTLTTAANATAVIGKTNVSKPATEMTLLASLPIQQQVADASATTANPTTATVSPTPINILGGSAGTTLVPNTAAATNRTITFNLPIKALASTNGVLASPTLLGNNVIASTNASSATVPVALSDTNAASAAATATTTSTAAAAPVLLAANAMSAQDFLKYFSASQLIINPAGGATALPRIIPAGISVLQSQVKSEVTTAGASKESSEAQKVDKAAVNGDTTGDTTKASTTTPTTSTNNDASSVVADEDDAYAGYTEEELAFMQRLQENRSTTSATESTQDKEGVHMDENASSHSPSSSSHSSASSSNANTNGVEAGENPLMAHSAPPSICPEGERRRRLQKEALARVERQEEVEALRRRIDQLDAQVNALTQLIFSLLMTQRTPDQSLPQPQIQPTPLQKPSPQDLQK